jgi:hypothetical protein
MANKVRVEMDRRPRSPEKAEQIDDKSVRFSFDQRPSCKSIDTWH